MTKSLKHIFLAGITSSLLTPSLTTFAVSLQTGWGAQLSPFPGTPVYQISDAKGNVYEVPYVLKANSNNKRYTYYGTGSNNAFFRRTYGDTVTYQPVPYGAARLAGKDYYTWSDLYENIHRPYSHSHNTFESSSVRENTVNCGYIGSSISCVAGSNAGNLNPGGVSGHTNINAGIRLKDGQFGGIGTWGESRFVGYSLLGNHIDNTYYPMDNPKNYTSANYPYDSKVAFVSKLSISPTAFDGFQYRAQKLDAIAQLLRQEGMPGRPEDWLEKLSLQTNPVTEAPVFLATRHNGAGYQALIVKAPASATMNLSLMSLRLFDKTTGEEIVGVKRNVPGGDSYTASFGDKPLEARPQLEAGETYRLEVVIQNTSQQATKKKTQHVVVDGKEYTSCGSLGVNQTCTFTMDYTAPDQGNQKVKISSEIPHDPYASTGDNLTPGDDYLGLELLVNEPPKGDTALNEVYLVEAKTNEVVTHPIQGVEYYFQFKGSYVGDSMRGNELTFKIKADINTPIPQSNGTTANHKFTTFTDEIKTKLPESDSQNPLIFDFKSPTFKATSSLIELNATLIGPDGFKWDYNTNKGNDTLTQKWTAPVNLVMHKATLNPGSHPGGDYCGTLDVAYYVDFDFHPQYLAEYAEKYPNKLLQGYTIPVAFYVNNNLIKTENIKVYGLEDKRKYTTQLDFSRNCVSPNTNIKIVINPTHILEEYKFNDNTAIVTWGAKYPADYCENHSNPILKWDQKYLDLSIIGNGYADNVDQLLDRDWIISKNYEQLGITKIEMRSKLMADKGIGTDGWLNVVTVKPNGTIEQIATPEIKAGYGFDLRVTVEYETDAYHNETTEVLSKVKYSQLHTPLKPLNLIDDLFIKLPGTTTKTISTHSTGDLKLERTVTQPPTSDGKTKVTWVYTLQNRLSPNGTNEYTNSLFVDENTKDGEYEIGFYTFPVYGIPDKTAERVGDTDVLKDYDPLCSNVTIKFKVNGSVYDDLNVGVIH